MNRRALVFSLFALICLTVAVVFNVRTHRFLSRSVQVEATVISVSPSLGQTRRSVDRVCLCDRIPGCRREADARAL
jgi:hypothetical protein